MSNLPKKLQEIKERCEKADPSIELVEEWQQYWMNQTQNSKEDFDNYYRRAFGVDANMRHSLAKRIDAKLADIPRLVKALEACMEQRRRMTYNELTEDERKMFFANKVLDSMDQELEAILEGNNDPT